MLPYDHSRVVLNELANATGSDYINASTIVSGTASAHCYDDSVQHCPLLSGTHVTHQPGHQHRVLRHGIDLFPTMAAALSLTFGRGGALFGNLVFISYLIDINCVLPIALFAAMLFGRYPRQFDNASVEPSPVSFEGRGACLSAVTPRDLSDPHCNRARRYRYRSMLPWNRVPMSFEVPRNSRLCA